MHDQLPLSGLTIAFDLDGTLVDTAPDLIGALNTVLGEEGLAALPYEDVRLMVGRGAKALLARGFAAAGAPLDAERAPGLVERFIAVYLSRIAQESTPFPGAIEALEKLRADGAKLCVCTNKLTGLSTALLDALDMTKLFDAVIGQDLAPAPKPDARHLLVAIEAVGGRADRALLVGDSVADVGAGKNAKVPVIVVGFGYTEAPASELGGDIVIDHFDELDGVVRAWAKRAA